MHRHPKKRSKLRERNKKKIHKAFPRRIITKTNNQEEIKLGTHRKTKEKASARSHLNRNPDPRIQSRGLEDRMSQLERDPNTWEDEPEHGNGAYLMHEEKGGGGGLILVRADPEKRHPV